MFKIIFAEISHGRGIFLNFFKEGGGLRQVGFHEITTDAASEVEDGEFFFGISGGQIVASGGVIDFADRFQVSILFGGTE